jgi:hypothetical protein
VASGRNGWLAGIVAASVASTSTTAAAPSPTDDAIDKKIAVWRFDALGIDPELVARLETLFRNELDRLDRQPLPTRQSIEGALTTKERECTGEEKCLSAIGKRLGVELVVTGTVGAMGDSYVLNIKAVEVATGKSQRITTDPLKGSPDDLIEGVRVAAYRLLAPEHVNGSLQIQSDLVGAKVTLDGKELGKTPLANNGVVAKLALGKHQLHVEAKDYAPFDDVVDVHFQKLAPIIVRLLPSNETVGSGRTIRIVEKPFYSRPWFIAGSAITAIAVGVVVGYFAGRITCHDPSGRTVAC